MTDERTWLSAEMDKDLAEKFKGYLREIGLKYESSEAGNLIHFEVHVTHEEAKAVNEWIDRYFPKIKNVIFNEPATIVFWSDNTKTVVKCYEEPFDPEKGIAMAFVKKIAEMNGEIGYYRQIKKWADKYWEQEEVREKFEDRLGKIMKDYLPFLALANNLNTPDASD